MKTFAVKYLVLGIAVLLFSCKGKDKAADDEDAKVASQTPVTVTTVNDSTLVDYIDLTAKKLCKSKCQRVH